MRRDEEDEKDKSDWGSCTRTGRRLIAVALGLALALPGLASARSKSLQKAMDYCKNRGYKARKCKDCGRKNSKKCKCCYKKKPFWCPKGMAKAPNTYGIYKCCITGKKSKAVKRDLNKVRNTLSVLNPLSITKAYDLYFAYVASGKTGKKQALKSSVVKAFQPYYDFDLKKVKLGESKRTVNPMTAMTNCKTIWFPHGRGMVRKIQNDRLSDSELHWFAHELEHTEQCLEKGGKRNYAKMWFGQVPTTWIKLILNGKPGDIKGNGLHDAMPMESSADKKGDKVLRGLR